MKSRNYEMVLKVANALEELNEEVVYVGGAICEFYAKRVIAEDVRPTIDVDVVVEVSSRLDFEELNEKIRKKGFRNDYSEGAPICRWKYDSIIVDIMPNDKSILGFSNIWYKDGVKTSFEYDLSNELSIRLFQPEYFLATKIEAIKGRATDLRMSMILKI